MIGKNSTFEEKLNYLREGLRNKNNSEDLFIVSVLNLIGCTNLNTSLIESDNIIFKDLAEYSDIKTELKEDLNVLKKEIALDYLSVLLSCRNIKSVKSESVKRVDNINKIIIVNLGIFTLNNILNSFIKDIDLNSISVIDDAISIMHIIVSPMIILDDTLNSLYKVK